MPTNDYATMVKYGEWLKVLLGKDLKTWQLKKQFQKAITLLNLNYIS